MTEHDPDVRALRDALLPAAERDLAATRRRPGRRAAIGLAAGAAMLAGAGAAAATGVLFADPKVPDVPAAPEWRYVSQDPRDPDGGGGPAIMRPKPEALDRTTRALERELAERGVAARCGTDRAHPLACYLPSGDIVPPADYDPAFVALEGAEQLDGAHDNYEIRPLTEAEARRWLCDHPEQRPSDEPPDPSC